MSPAPRPSRRQFLTTGLLAAGSAAALSACSAPADSATPVPTITPVPPTDVGMPTTGPAGDSWAPQPLDAGALSVLAAQRGDRLLLHTVGGDRDFWAGVGLSPALPGHLRTDHAPGVGDYRRWFGLMAELGVRLVRLDALEAPALYEALASHNDATPESPLYLLQGVRVPAIAATTGRARSFADHTKEMSAAIADASAAIHGDLRRRDTSVTPRGSWSADVSPWVAAWLVGASWNPDAVLVTDRGASSSAPFSGRYFMTMPGATATERWIAARMEELAAHEAKRGCCVPIGAANHPATDPLTHPEEPNADEDRVGVDVNHIGVLTAWPAGTFAAYTAMPYDPTFLRHQASYAESDDPYRAYLQDLRTHHSSLPLLITETGVPSSLGQSNLGANDRNEGFLSEQQMMKVDADLLTMLRDLGCTGGLLSAWNDDWSASSRPTAPRVEKIPPARRALWHDPLTSGQWFGLLAHDVARAGQKVVHDAPTDEMTRVVTDHDAAYLYLTFYFTRRVTSPVDVGFDLYGSDGLRLPGGSGDPKYDVALQLVPTMSTVTMYVRRTLDPTRLDGLPSLFLPRATLRGWVDQQLTLSGPVESPGGDDVVPAEMQRVGELVMGSWDPTDQGFDSRATWQLVRPDPMAPMEWRVRLPWSMLTFADPTRRLGLIPNLGEPTLLTVRGMDVTIESSTPGSPASFTLPVPTWDDPPATTERLKAGSEVLRAAFADTASHTAG